MKQKNTATIYTIAEKAHVSPATVSRALNHPELIHPDTLNRILAACKELNYTKRPYHIDSKTQTTTTSQISQMSMAALPIQGEAHPLNDFLLVSPSPQNPFYNEIIEGAIRTATSHGCRLYVEYTALNERNINSYLNAMDRRPFAGYIFLIHLSDAVLLRLKNKCHFIQCSEYSDTFTEASYVSIDDYQAQRQAAEHVFRQGIKKPAYITMPLTLHFAKRRMQGFLDALKEYHLSIPDHWIVSLPQVHFSLALDAANRLLSEAERPDAIICISDLFAAACEKAALAKGLSIPKDIKIMGFDDIPVAVQASPTISTVHQPRSQLGSTAFEILYKEAGASKAPAPQHILLPTELLLREST